MRKWLGLYIAVCLAATFVLSGAIGFGTAMRADFGRITDEDGYLSQIVRTERDGYVLYRNPEQTRFQVETVDAAGNDMEIVATAHQDGVYALYRYTEGAKQLFGIERLGATAEEAEAWQPALLEAEGEVLAFGADGLAFYCSIQSEDGKSVTEYTLPLAEPTEWTTRQVFNLPEGHFAVCGAYDAGALWFALEDGRVYARTSVVSEVDTAAEDTVLAAALRHQIVSGAEGKWKLYYSMETAKEVALPVLLVAAVAVLLLYQGRKQNHLVYRLLCCTEVFCCAALLLGGSYLAERLTRQRVLEIGVEAGHVLGEMQSGQKADGTVSADTYWAAMQERSGLLEDLLIVAPETGEVLLAKTLPAGTVAADVYGTGIDAIAAEVAAGNQTIMTRLSGGGAHPSPYVVALRDWTEMQADTVLLTVLSESGIQKNVDAQVSQVWRMVYALLTLLTLLHIALFARFSRRWRRFEEGIAYVATEKKSYPESPTKRDGLQSVWLPLERIGRNLGELYYERERFYRSYYRFVPKDMEVLLKKPELVDMEIGDRNKINGCMAQCRLGDLKQLDGADYMRVMTASMEQMHRLRKKWNGIYLNSTPDLLERKIFFERDARSAAQFAVEFLHAFADAEESAGRDMIVLLHAAEFQYGISGVQDMMTPYMYSAQESILEPYVAPLAKARVKLAMTEQTVQLIGSGFSLRYIGFVSGSGLMDQLKLYECLDAYPEKQRRLMLETDTLFRRGLQLFYSDDFYLARNTFNEVLKLNEQDQIARWYLFHCEYHLNRTDAPVSYGLFEAMGLEEGYRKTE